MCCEAWGEIRLKELVSCHLLVLSRHDLAWDGWLLRGLLLCKPFNQLLLHYVGLPHLAHVLKRDPFLVVLKARTVLGIIQWVQETITRLILPSLSPSQFGSLYSLILSTLVSGVRAHTWGFCRSCAGLYTPGCEVLHRHWWHRCLCLSHQACNVGSEDSCYKRCW